MSEDDIRYWADFYERRHRELSNAVKEKGYFNCAFPAEQMKAKAQALRWVLSE